MPIAEAKDRPESKALKTRHKAIVNANVLKTLRGSLKGGGGHTSIKGL